MEFEILKVAKESYERVTEATQILEENGWIKINIEDLDIFNILRYDLGRFIEYLIASDGTIEKCEVDVFRYITGFSDETVETLKNSIENEDITKFEFQSEPPYSLKYLVDGTNEYFMQIPDAEKPMAGLLADYLFTFCAVGRSVVTADDTVTYSEKSDLKAYLQTLLQYIRVNSYVANSDIINEVSRRYIETSDI